MRRKSNVNGHSTEKWSRLLIIRGIFSVCLTVPTGQSYYYYRQKKAWRLGDLLSATFIHWALFIYNKRHMRRGWSISLGRLVSTLSFDLNEYDTAKWTVNAYLKGILGFWGLCVCGGGGPTKREIFMTLIFFLCSLRIYGPIPSKRRLLRFTVGGKWHTHTHPNTPEIHNRTALSYINLSCQINEPVRTHTHSHASVKTNRNSQIKGVSFLFYFNIRINK